MLANFTLSKALTFTGLASLMAIGLISYSQPSSATSESEQSAVVSPNRRKPGAARQIASPERRKPGGTRQIASPERRKPGGARTDIARLLNENARFASNSSTCEPEVFQMTALIPENLQGLSASATPTLYFAVPVMSTSPDLEFVLQDSNQRVIYAAKVESEASGGIMSLQIPESHALEANKEYHWYLSVICDAQHRERDVVVEGLIKQVQSETPLTSVSAQERIQFYQQKGLWHDALHTLVNLQKKQENSANLQEIWKVMLDSVNLSQLETLLPKQPIFKANPQPLPPNSTLISQID